MKEFNIKRFFNVFEKHVQGGKEEFFNKDWSAGISIFKFTNNLRNKRKKSK